MYEKEIEDQFIDWFNAQPGRRVIGRQVPLPLGRLDVLGVVGLRTGAPVPVVAEIKRAVVNERACVQALGYQHQIQHLLSTRVEVCSPEADYFEPVECDALVVGDAITPLADRLARHYGLTYVRWYFDHGGVAFEVPYDEYDGALDGPVAAVLEKLAHQVAGGRRLRRARNAAAFRSAEAYSFMLDGRADHPPLSETVAYWRNSRA